MLALVALVLTVIVVAAIVIIYVNPGSRLNPFPPPTTTPVLALASATFIPQPTIAPSRTPVSVSILTTNTAEVIQPAPATPTMVASATQIIEVVAASSDDYAFVLRQGSPAAIDAAQFHADAGCNWLGVAGQATSLNGEAVRGLFVHLGGTLDGKDMDLLTMTGLAAQYGAGGFEITLTDRLISSNSSLWVQLLDAQNLPLSNKVYFSTFDDCTKNLVIIYFDQVR